MFKPHFVQALHRHDDARLILFTSGAYTERSFTSRGTFAPGDYIFRPAYYAHDGLGGPGAGYVKLPLSGQAISRYAADHGWLSRRGRVPHDQLDDLLRNPWAGDDILAASETEPLDVPTPCNPFESVAASLCQRNPPPIGRLAQAHAFSTWSLSRHFRRYFFVNPCRFRLEARVQRAIGLIAETDLSLSQIAAEAGFSDQSHLTRATRRYTGDSPATIRRNTAR
ncbi:MAG: AraC family transcriptional regulator [Pseudomonadota bacterium]